MKNSKAKNRVMRDFYIFTLGAVEVLLSGKYLCSTLIHWQLQSNNYFLFLIFLVQGAKKAGISKYIFLLPIPSYVAQCGHYSTVVDIIKQGHDVMNNRH